MKIEDFEKIIAKYKQYNKYAGGQIHIDNYYEDYEYRGNINKVFIKKEDNSERLIVSLDLLAKKVLDPTVRWITQCQTEYSVTLNTEHFNLCSLDKESDGRIVLNPAFSKETAIIYPKDHHSIKPIIIEEDIGRRKDGSKQVDSDTMKMYLFKGLRFETNLDVLLEKITPEGHGTGRRINIHNINEKYDAIFSEQRYTENHSIISLYLMIKNEGIFYISNHALYIPGPYIDYQCSEIEFFYPEGEYTAILKDDKIKLATKLQKEYKYHNGYYWDGLKSYFNIEKSIDLDDIYNAVSIIELSDK